MLAQPYFGHGSACVRRIATKNEMRKQASKNSTGLILNTKKLHHSIHKAWVNGDRVQVRLFARREIEHAATAEVHLKREQVQKRYSFFTLFARSCASSGEEAGGKALAKAC